MPPGVRFFMMGLVLGLSTGAVGMRLWMNQNAAGDLAAKPWRSSSVSVTAESGPGGEADIAAPPGSQDLALRDRSGRGGAEANFAECRAQLAAAESRANACAEVSSADAESAPASSITERDIFDEVMPQRLRPTIKELIDRNDLSGDVLLACTEYPCVLMMQHGDVASLEALQRDYNAIRDKERATYHYQLSEEGGFILFFDPGESDAARERFAAEALRRFKELAG